MDIINAIIQGVIQGLTEFLPVSSSGHLSLYQHFTGNSGEAGVVFSILLHFGTLAAVFAAFYKTIWELVVEFFRAIVDIFKGKFSFKNMNAQRRMICLLVVSLVPLVAVFPLKDAFERTASDGDIIVEGVCFLITSALLFLSEKVVGGKKDAGNMKYRDAVAVGVAQAIAPMPGISRSGSTIATGLIAGLSKEYAVAYSFILGIPAVLGANVLNIPDAIEVGAEAGWVPMIIGAVCAAVFGFLAIKMVKWLVGSNRFKIFAIYTLVLGVAVIGIGIYEKISGAPIF